MYREGRAMIYLDTIALAILDLADPQAKPPFKDIRLYRNYAVLLLAKGVATTEEDVHNAWSAWAAEHRTQSKCIVPFSQLTLSEQMMDTPYVDAIRQLARAMTMGKY